MSAIPSDEVAEDYRNSLDDLITNDRYAISNLTLIAKENIEHAEAISRVLQNHIQRVSRDSHFHRSFHGFLSKQNP
jgi:pre-mRNA cleavage complex 2 protein Pcf11